MRKISSYFTPVRTKKDEKHAADSPVSRRASSFQGQELVVPEETHSIKATTEDRSECNSKVLLESDSQILLGNVFAKSRKKMTVLSAQEETPFPSKRNLNVGSTCNDSILKENFQQPAVPSLFNDDDDDDDFPISKRRRILRSASFVRSQKKNNSRKEDSDSEFKEESDSCLDEDESELDASSEDISPVNCNFDSMDRRPLNKTPQSKKSKIASKNCVEAEADLNFRPSIDGALSSIESKFSSIDFKNGSQMNPLQKSKLMSQDRASACLTNEKNINETVNASWLRNRKDKNGRSPTDPDFDNRTLYIPKASLAMMTPAQRQYWEIKSENMDVVLFFKMGKFYELFDVDAEIGHKELDLMYMKSERPHVGFPEAGFSKFSERLVHLGYKIGRVEQTETPDEMKERNRLLSGKNKSKVVNREMVSLLTKGTLVDPEIIGKDDASYLLSLREGSPGKIGVCFVDTSTGSFSIGEFQDDTSRTLLRTLLAQIRPEEVIYPKGNLTEKTLSTVTKETKKALINVLIDGSEFWDADRSVLEIENYFDQEIPVDLKAVFKSCELSVSAFGGCVWYLRRVLLDQELLSIGHFSLYNPIDETMAEFLILDGHTLSNLEVRSYNS